MFDHFLRAQQNVYPRVVDELRNGRKRSHWMWFIFPQLVGLGNSPNAARYGLDDLDEARAFAQHPVLGHRLRECVAITNAIERTAHQIFGYPDELKFRSSLTLFWLATDEEGFREGLDKFYRGEPDSWTVKRLGQ